MSIVKNIAAFKNWPLFYAGRYGFLRNEFEMIHRSGIRIKVRPQTDDLKIVKSNFVTMHYIRDFVPITKGSIVVDVGAHIGSFCLIAAKSADRVLAYEPEPSNYQMLKKNVELNNLKNVTIFEMAVSGSSGHQEFCAFEDGSTGSHFLSKGGSNHLVKKRVPIISLEDIIKKEGLSQIDFLKLDCEGAEHDILREMSLDTATRIRGIAMETHRVPPEFSFDIPARLTEIGFEVRTEHHGGYVYARRIIK
jgi:FkbM family methyltransferase